MKIAFMFPGQGSQYVGMGGDLFDTCSDAKKYFTQADEILEFDLSKLMFFGPEEELKQTQNTQPAILTHSVALWSILTQELQIKNFSVIGHSLGEYSAYVASQRLDFKDAIDLVRKRGIFMSESSRGDYGMAAVLRLSIPDLGKILETYGQNEVFVANDNCPGQVVISGLKSRIGEIQTIIEEQAGKLIMLPVSGAFHSPYMKEAALKLEQALSHIQFSDSQIPLYSNVSTQKIIYGQEKNSLIQQVYSGVLFTQSIKNMILDGLDTFVEVGPGKVLQGLVKKIDKNVRVLGVQTPEDIKNITKELG